MRIEQNFHFQDMDDEMLCGDLLFSGHTLAMVISSLTVAYYLPDSFRPLRSHRRFHCHFFLIQLNLIFMLSQCSADIYHACYHGSAWFAWLLAGHIILLMFFLHTGCQRLYLGLSIYLVMLNC